MTSPILSQPNIRAGMCPHGLPQSSCPICSKQLGGGAGVMNNTAVHKNAHAGEWSYQKCYVAGLEIKAAMQHKVDAQNFLEKQFQFALQVNRNIQNISDKLNQFIQNIKSPNLQASMQFLMNNIITPLLNTLTQISKFIDKFAHFQEKAVNMLLQAGEKLAGILGEIKNFVERKIVDNIKKKAKKFMLFCLSVIDDENYKNDETLAVFKAKELKKYIVKILKKREDNDNRSSKNQ